MLRWIGSGMLAVLAAAGGAQAQSEGELARQTQNPIADLISLPFQNNNNVDFARQDRVQNVLNIQPVWPVQLNDDWNLITRTILPLVNQPELRRSGRNRGFGDLNFTGWLSPRKPAELTWGLGGTIRLPTASDDELGSGKASVGPSVVALRMSGPWVAGGLAQHVLSIGGDGGRRNVSETLIQPFVNYNLADGWYLTTSPIVTANWKARKSGDTFELPVGGGFGRVFRVGERPINTSVQTFYNVASRDPGGRWTLRLQVQLLFPK